MRYPRKSKLKLPLNGRKIIFKKYRKGIGDGLEGWGGGVEGVLGGGGLKDQTSLPFFGSPPFFVILSLCHDAFLSTSLDTLRFLSLSSGEGFCLNIDIFVDQFFLLKAK